jgi:hypothetical protein
MIFNLDNKMDTLHFSKQGLHEIHEVFNSKIFNQPPLRASDNYLVCMGEGLNTLEEILSFKSLVSR